jgi:triosephosphate isomerase
MTGMTTKYLIIGNWKMNPSSPEEAAIIVKKTRTAAATLIHTSVVVCPPFVFIPLAVPRQAAANFFVGAQSVSAEEGGPHTGLVSATMLQSVGVEYVIVGHSEERAQGLSNAEVARRAAAVIHSGMKAVVCVGEKVRDADGAYLEMLKIQIRESCAGLKAEDVANMIVAYEPIWAVGAPEPMGAEQIYETSLFVKKVLTDIFGQEAVRKVRVLYGGAVNSRNAAEIMNTGKVDGLLVGRESVNATGFVELVKAVDLV